MISPGKWEPRPTAAERAIVSAVRWGHLTPEAAAIRLGSRAVKLLSSLSMSR